MQQGILIYQAYGQQAILEECLWSILSLSKWLTPEEAPFIVIYTDRPDWFQSWQMPFAHAFQELTAEKISAWRGPNNFVHRLKVALLQDALAQYQAPLLYADTDSEFLQSPLSLLAAIAEGRHYMHVCEGKLSQPQQPVRQKLLNFFSKKPSVPGFRPSVTGDTLMWNAGALGLTPADKGLLEEVLALTDALYPLYSKHIIEQFAFSVVLQAHGSVHSAAPWLLHYWNFKEWRLWLASFFERFKGESWGNLVQYSQLIQVHVPLQEKMGFYQRRSLWGKISKEKWQPDLPQWDQLL